jgi:hypothetical protein
MSLGFPIHWDRVYLDWGSLLKLSAIGLKTQWSEEDECSTIWRILDVKRALTERKTYSPLQTVSVSTCLLLCVQHYNISLCIVAHSSSNAKPKTIRKPTKTNTAFVFIKPHANTVGVISLTRELLNSQGFVVEFEGEIDGSIIDKEWLLDRQYADIARKSVLLKPNELQLQLPPAAFMRFRNKFKIDWAAAVEDNSVFNAVDAAAALGVSYEVLNDAWLDCIRVGNMVKFDRGCYCGYLNSIAGAPPIFCINGFYMHMRAQYVAPGASIHYFLVRWTEDLMTWEAFRRRVIGSANPAMAQSGSLRSIIASEWKELNLVSEPNMEDNGIHSSASAFEAFVERMIWLNETSLTNDPFASKMLNAGIPETSIREWSLDSTVADKSVFELMENKGTEECISMALELCRELEAPPAPDGITSPPSQNMAQGFATATNFSPAGGITNIPRTPGSASGAPIGRLPPLTAERANGIKLFTDYSPLAATFHRPRDGNDAFDHSFPVDVASSPLAPQSDIPRRFDSPEDRRAHLSTEQRSQGSDLERASHHRSIESIGSHHDGSRRTKNGSRDMDERRRGGHSHSRSRELRDSLRSGQQEDRVYRERSFDEDSVERSADMDSRDIGGIEGTRRSGAGSHDGARIGSRRRGDRDRGRDYLIDGEDFRREIHRDDAEQQEEEGVDSEGSRVLWI